MGRDGSQGSLCLTANDTWQRSRHSRHNLIRRHCNESTESVML